MPKRVLLTLLTLAIATSLRAQQRISCRNDLADLITINQPLAGESISRYMMTPGVVPLNSTQAILLEVTTTGQPSELRLVNETTQTTVVLTDAGTNGDKKAKDGIFSATVAPPGGKWSEPFLGFIRLLVNGTQLSQANCFMLLLTPDMPAVTPKKIDNATQYSDYVFNLVIPSTAATPSDNNRQAYTKTFYNYHADEFDFVNYVLVPGFLDNRFHGTINNTVQGIGFGTGGLANPAAAFGSAGRLIGYNQFPIPDFFDGANQGYIHEVAHQWINQSTKSFLKDGVPHWPLSNLATAVMGYSGGASRQGSNFPYTFVDQGSSWQLLNNPKAQENGYNEWELYLMGLMPASEVKTAAVIFKDQLTIPQGGTFPKTAFNTYTINDYIAIEGQRIPNAAQSQKRYGIATIVLSETLLTPTEMAYYDYMARRAEGRTPVATREGFVSYMGKPFQVATGERATLRALLNTNANCASVPTRPTIGLGGGGTTFCQGGSTVLTAPQNATYIWYLNGVPLPERAASLTVTQAGNYALSVRNAAGCSSPVSSEVTVSVSSAPATPILSVTGSASACTGSAVVLWADGNGTAYQWLLNGIPIAGAVSSTYSATTAGSYAVTTQHASACPSAASTPVAVSINPIPPRPTISFTANGLVSSIAAGNQWLLNGAIIPNATGQTFPGTVAGGGYSVRVTINGCTSVSDILTITGNEPAATGTIRLRHVPNPAGQFASISFDLPRPMRLSIQLLSSGGTFLRQLADGTYPAGTTTVGIDTSTLPTGLYLYRLETDGGSQTNKLMVSR
ncbi:T9SS type A sorting domain-containing protein [Fibrella arboris]|uniref:T9SS type A sorting domain-containing protein n=1 Tax=Fibrella arboris TaxID=3242486 RepID=UPI003521CC59